MLYFAKLNVFTIQFSIHLVFSKAIFLAFKSSKKRTKNLPNSDFCPIL